MSALTIAKKEFKDGIRSRSLLVLVPLFGLLMAGAAYFFTEIAPLGGSDDPRTKTVILSLFVPTYIALPIIGTMLGYKSISGERELGSLKFLLGLPHTRRDVVLGKLAGLSGIMIVAVISGFAVGGVALFTLHGTFRLGDYVALMSVAIVLGVVFVSIAIAFSSAVRSSTVATAGAITLVLIFLFLWDGFLTVVAHFAGELSFVESSTVQSAEWYLFLQYLNPAIAYQGAVAALLDMRGGPTSVLANPPFYLEEWFGFVILAFWLAVPIGLSYLRFRRTDL
ncbi:ABC transporter permease [Halosolutus gelatinilyticus]|uniref:ABC transporter permease n=1 Tax=Halosolutus gelatinilyticus TaxID=2931975 RepID=UPI001FF5D625|nr:ABC transporter permease [Halosolutus gelatinilyticus]